MTNINLTFGTLATSTSSKLVYASHYNRTVKIKKTKTPKEAFYMTQIPAFISMTGNIPSFYFLLFSCDFFLRVAAK